MHLVKVIYRVPLISVLGLFGSRNTHCLQKEYHKDTNKHFFEIACLLAKDRSKKLKIFQEVLKECMKPTFHL